MSLVVPEKRKSYIYVCNIIDGVYDYVDLSGIKKHVGHKLMSYDVVTRLYFYPEYFEEAATIFKLQPDDSLLITEDFSSFRVHFNRYLHNCKRKAVVNQSEDIKNFYANKYKG